MVKPGQSKLPPKLLQGAIWAAEAALVALILYGLVRSFIGYTTPESLWTDIPSTVIAKDTRTGTRSVAVNTRFDPFFREEAVAPVEAGQDAPETSLNLILTGMNVGERGSAILQTPDNVQKSYSVGEEIISGVKLHAVTADYVVLSLNGRLERLTFTRDQPATLSRVKPSSVTSAQSFLASVNLTPVREDGKMTGYRLSSKTGAANLSAFGLQNGDVVTQVDNIDLSSVTSLAALQSSMNKKTSVNLTILRDGRTITHRVGTP